MVADIFYWVVAHGDAALLWTLVFVGGLLSKLILHFITNGTAKAVASRAITEVGDAVMEVAQTYVADIKAGSADGTLTDAEKKAAKDKAIATAKKNIGTEGLQRLERILGVDVESWLGTKVEAAVGALKSKSTTLASATLDATAAMPAPAAQATPSSPQ